MSFAARRASLDGRHFYVVVIGGGINGVAIARECARAGASTLLVEQDDFASGTTSRSTRIIHGGLRYLEHAEITLVRESLQERDFLLRQYPHFVRPLRFLIAMGPESRRSALTIRTGLWLYRRISRPHSNRSTSAELADFERQLDNGTRWDLFDYDDAQCEFPERLVAEWAREAAAAGANLRNHTQALAAEAAAGRVAGVRLRDELTGDEFRVSCDWVINATGPWADRFSASSGASAPTPMIAGVRGSHLVLPLTAAAPKTAIYTEALDGRPIFVIPWNRQLLVGTTEVPDPGDPGRTKPSTAEIEYLLSSARRLLPGVAASWDDIQYTFSGVRPLPFSPGTQSSAITRRHLLHDHSQEGLQGMLSLIGGKLTTAGKVGRECARAIGLQVAEPVMSGALISADPDGLADRFIRKLTEAGALNVATASAIADWFGGHSQQVTNLAASNPRMQLPLCDHTPHIVAEAVYAAQFEFAVTLADLLLRRIPVALSACWTDECTRLAAERIGAVLNWDQKTMTQERERFEEERAAFLTKPQRVKDR